MGNYTADQLWSWALELPEQLAVRPVGLDEVGTPASPRRVVVCGMGGSGVSAQFLSGLGPLIPWRWAGVPGWLDSGDALVAVSYSGGTFETVSAAEAALERGAALWGITGGGRLAELLGTNGCPALGLPSGLPPRAAFGYLFGAALRLGETLTGQRLWQPETTLDELARRRDELVADDFSLLRALASNLADRQVVVYGTCPLTAAAALRWKQQLNENAKLCCWWGALPEVSHNEIEAAGPGLAPRRVVLTLSDEPPPLDQVLGDGEVTLSLTPAPGEPLARTLDLVLQGDLLSLLIAAERGVDAGGIPRIEAFKVSGWVRRIYGGDCRC